MLVVFTMCHTLIQHTISQLFMTSALLLYVGNYFITPSC